MSKVMVADAEFADEPQAPALPDLNKQRLRELMETARVNTEEVAQLLSLQMRRTYTMRTVQTWLADESKRSSRRCPAWVIENLEDILKRKKKV